MSENHSITVAPGSIVENVYVTTEKSTTWNLHGNLWRSSRLEENSSSHFTAQDCFFDDVALGKCGRLVKDLWSTRWTLTNCVVAGKFMSREIHTKYYSILANRCTFQDVQLCSVKFQHDPALEAQSSDFAFTNCRFIRCTLPESFLATTVDCVFEDCRFAKERADWSLASKPINVSAYIGKGAQPPESYRNGSLAITFKATVAPPSGSTLPFTYENGRLVAPSIPPKEPIVSIGPVENKPGGKKTDAAPDAPVDVPAAPINPTTQAATAELVKTYSNSLVFVSGTTGDGSGFLAKYSTGNFLFTNAHVAAGVRGATFKTLEGTEVKLGAASCAVGHDVFLMQATTSGQPFEIMKEVDQNASIGDEVVVLGNAEGAGVINTIVGKIVGLGPQLVEVDAPFQPGNSGSPIIHLKSGKVIGLATYAMIRRYDPATKEPVKKPVVRRFGYRLDSIKSWQPVNWQTFFAQANEVETIEKLTADLAAFLNDLADGKGIHTEIHSNPAIKSRIDAWHAARAKGLSPRDAAMANQSLIAFLKVACQSDVTAARQRITFDYFQRKLADQQKERDEISKIFSDLIQDLRK